MLLGVNLLEKTLLEETKLVLIYILFVAACARLNTVLSPRPA